MEPRDIFDDGRVPKRQYHTPGKRCLTFCTGQLESAEQHHVTYFSMREDDVTTSHSRLLS